MPKIKFDRKEEYVQEQPKVPRTGLRAETGRAPEIQYPRTEREKEDCFDMYRIDWNGKGRQGRVSRGPPRGKMTARKDGPQMWYAVCLLAALGAFCIFCGCITVEIGSITLSYTPMDVMMNARKHLFPDGSLYLALMPLAYIGIFVACAYMKEDVFEKPMILMLTAGIPMAVLAYEGYEVMNAPMELFVSYYPGIGVLLEIACSIGIIGIAVCQRFLSSGRTPARRSSPSFR